MSQYQERQPDEGHHGNMPEDSPADLGQQAEEPGQPSTADRRLLRRSKRDRVIAGVCGGLGRYFEVDPVLFRIAFILLLVPGGAGLIIYIISWIAMPEFKNELEETRDTEGTPPVDRRMAGTLIGGLFILFGIMILLQQFVDWFEPEIIGAAVLIIIGAIIVMRGLR